MAAHRDFRLDWMQVLPRCDRPVFIDGEDSWTIMNASRAPRLAHQIEAWLEAARECGHRGFVETRVTQRRGARWSTADAYLKPALQRKIGATNYKTEYFHRSLLQRWRARPDYRPEPLKDYEARIKTLLAGPMTDEIYPVA